VAVLPFLSRVVGFRPDTWLGRARVSVLTKRAISAGLAATAAAAVADQSQGASEASAFSWKADPAFVERVNELRGELFSQAVNILAGMNGTAARRLAKLVQSTNEKVALAAARTVLEVGRTLRESDELVQRVAKLERTLSGARR
jgi:hypothetical protein